MRLSQLLKMKPDTMSQSERNEILKVEKLLKDRHYKPHVSTLTLTKQEYEVLINSDSVKIVNGQKIIKIRNENTEMPQDMAIKNVVIKDEFIYLYIHSVEKSLAKIFINDFNGLHRYLRSFDSPYYNLSPEWLYADEGSHWDMHDPAIKQFFAPEFCQYMTDYIKLKENYCAIPSKAQCSR